MEERGLRRASSSSGATATRRSRIGHRLLVKMGLRQVGPTPMFDAAHKNYTWLKHYVEEMKDTLTAYALQVRGGVVVCFLRIAPSLVGLRNRVVGGGCAAVAGSLILPKDLPSLVQIYVQGERKGPARRLSPHVVLSSRATDRLAITHRLKLEGMALETAARPTAGPRSIAQKLRKSCPTDFMGSSPVVRPA